MGMSHGNELLFTLFCAVTVIVPSRLGETELMAGEFDHAWFQDLYRRVTDNFAAESKIADFLRTPEAYGVPREQVDAVRTAFIQQIIEDPSKRPALFGHSNTSSPETIARDQETIGHFLRTEFEKETITAEDLARIPYSDRPGHGSAELMSMLLSEDSGIGGAAEALAEHIRDRNQENDLAVAAMAFTSSPELMAKHLNEPEKFIPAFEALLEYNDRQARSGAASAVADQGIVAIAELYNAHAEEIVEHYAPSDSEVSRSEYLSWFYSQTIFNPHARDLEISSGQSVVDSVGGRTGAVVDGILESMQPSDPNSIDDASVRLGRLSAAMAGGVDYATSIHAGLIERDRENAEFITSAVDTLVRRIAGDKAGMAVDNFTDLLVEKAASGRLAPDASVAETFQDTIAAAAGREESRVGNYKLYEDVRDERNSEYNEHLLNQIQKGPPSPVSAVERDHASIDPVSIAPQSKALLTSPEHPQHARYAGCLNACADPALALAAGDRPGVAAALTAQSMVDGVPRVDTIVQNRDATLLIGVMGRLDDPASARTIVPREVAMHQTVEVSTQKVDALLEEQNRKAALQPPAPEREQTPRSIAV